jgi:penicillin-binding protein A
VTSQVRKVATLVLLLFGALFVNLNVVQVLQADDYATHPANRRLLIDEYQIRRGTILAGQEQIAHSEETEGDLKYLRRYDDPERYAHLLGFYSLVYGRWGLERAMNEDLTGTPTALLAENLAELLGQRDPVGNTVRLTVVPEVQAAAQEALGDRMGGVVAIEPSTGAVLASYSNPSYDPNRLSSHDPSDIRDYRAALLDDERDPLADRTRERRYQPGSAFKVIVAAAALERGLDPDTAFEDTTEYVPPQTTRGIRNFGQGHCAGGGTISFEQSMVVSCNVVFARLAVELGVDALVDQAERFGLNRTPPFVLPTAQSVIPDDLDPPATAQSAIGGRDVQTTPLQMAMVAAAIANDGVLMRPYVVDEILDPSGRRLRGSDPRPWIEGRRTGQAVSSETAAVLDDMLVEAVESGTGRNARIDGVRVGGKTGTAATGVADVNHVWFTGYAAAGEEGREVAVAVVVPDAGAGATGGAEAAPIAQAVMEAALAR